MSTHRTTLYSPTRHTYDGHRPGTNNGYSYETVTSAGGRSNASNSSTLSSYSSNVSYAAQPIRETFHPEGKRTEYLVRPRHNSTSAQDSRRPASISTGNRIGSPNHGSPTVSSPQDIGSAGLQTNGRLGPVDALVLRSPSGHQRHNSTSRADLDRSLPIKDRKERVYHVRGPEPPRQYYTSQPRPSREAVDNGFSYTGPREQFHRDLAQRPRRDSNSRRERPNSVYALDRTAALRREYGPPVVSRPAERIEKASSGHRSPRSGFDSDPDRYDDPPQRRSIIKAPVVHQPYKRDDGYSTWDEYEPRTHHQMRDRRYADDDRKNERRDSFHDSDRNRRRDRDFDRYNDDQDRVKEYDRTDRRDSRRKSRIQESSPPRSHLKDLAPAVAAPAIGGIIASLSGREKRDKDKERDREKEKDRDREKERDRNRDRDQGSNDEDKKERRRKHRHRSTTDEDSFKQSDDHYHYRSHKADDSSSDHGEKDQSKRRSHRRRRSEYEEEDDEKSSDSQRPPRPRSVSRSRHREEESDKPSGDLVLFNGHDDGNDGGNYDDKYRRSLEPRIVSPGENEDDRPRAVGIVEPEKKEEVKPRGILKAPRVVPFPEDPNPIREGVAPLKDAGKDGIPSNARWTKINRMLVNPEALEKANERFEEREDYVIVLRVLSREEIEKLAEKTAKIRLKREDEWKALLKKRERQQRRENGSGLSNDEDDDEENEKPQLAIEAAPSVPAADLRNLSQQPQAQYHPVPTRPASTAAVVPEVRVNDNYSQNV